jgi:hypothetical protein
MLELLQSKATKSCKHSSSTEMLYSLGLKGQIGYKRSSTVTQQACKKLMTTLSYSDRKTENQKLISS